MINLDNDKYPDMTCQSVNINIAFILKIIKTIQWENIFEE